MTNDIDLNKLLRELSEDDKHVLEYLEAKGAEWGEIIDAVASEYRVDDSVAVANLKKSAAVIMATLIGWVINRGRDETKES